MSAVTLMVPAEWMSPAQIAAELGCVRNTVHEAIARGDLPAIRYGRLVRVRRADFDAFLNAHTVRQETRP